MSWFVVECLGPLSEPMTIVCKDGAARAWTSLRMLHRHEFIDVEDLLESARCTGNPSRRVIRARDASMRLIDIEPVIGPDGDAHGMHLWIGPETEEPPPHCPASGMSWNLDDLQVRVTEQWWRNWRGPDGVAANPSLTLSPGEFFRNVVRFDRIEELMVQATDPDAGTTHRSSAVVLHDLGYLMTWYNVARGRKDEQHIGMRGLAIDVTDTDPPVISPVEVRDLSAGAGSFSARVEGWWTEPPPNDETTAAALLAYSPRLPMPVIAEWISRVPSWIDWERNGDPVTFHPNDCDALRRTFESRNGNGETITPARIRAFTHTGWQPVTVTSRRYPGEVGDRLHIVRIIKTGD
ncbi:GAF domain-containing protein [Nocardia sp. XZ_19_369]|uniref:GAF domain-containing protein n=1 Tax=Nocardia sp. XZ_19_369 TaxID=2769487 RepID=UPI0027D2F324|nr:GAF domain-containing protein [Nocardia sp. XZ_19_369]